MSGPFGSSQFMYATGAAEEGQSLRFEDGDSARLVRTFSNSSSTWTWSAWVKRGNLGSDMLLFGYFNGSPENFEMIRFDSSDRFWWYQRTGSTGKGQRKTSAVFRDVSAWYHFVVKRSGTSLNMYVNGEELTTFDTSETIATDSYINEAFAHQIGERNDGNNEFDGYLANVTFIDGTALDPTSFGEYDDTLWKPKSDTDIQALTFGTNGFYLPFKQTTQAEGFSTVTYTGNGSTQGIEGVGFEPDFVWIKQRNNVEAHALYDSVRGVGNALFSNGTNAETYNAGYLTSFDSNGFSVGSANMSNENNINLVAWCWDAGSGSAVSNTDGSITSSVKANTTNGFSIVTWTGNATGGATFGHGLTSAPDMVIVKNRTDAENWAVFHTSVGNTKAMTLNSTDSALTSTTYWNDASPTASVVSLGSDNSTNGSGDSLVAYCFHSVLGYSSIGSYSGTGATGNSITGLGFKPAWLMYKRSDSTGNWIIHDNTRDVDDDQNKRLYPNLSNAEQSVSPHDVTFDSDGFTMNTTGGDGNASGGTYIYMAFKDTRDATFFGDTSGNGNNWTPNALNNTDVVIDAPVSGGNFATLNPLTGGTSPVFSEGNLKVVQTTNSLFQASYGSFGVASGKWYAEVRVDDLGTNSTQIGVGSYVYTPSSSNQNGNQSGITMVNLDNSSSSSRCVIIDGVAQTGSNSGFSFSAGDIIGVAMDIDNDQVSFYKNNTLLGTGNHSLTTVGGGEFFLILFTRGNYSTGTLTANFGQDSSFAGNETPQGNTDDNGQGDFFYAPPSAFLALKTSNLPTPTITAPDEYFNTVLYTGTGASRSITGVNFQPDWIWWKGRNASSSHLLMNSVVGNTKYLYSNSTAAEQTDGTNVLTSFDSDGFTLPADTGGYANFSGRTYVAWNWLAGGTAVSNTDGSITSSVSAETDAGFSIVSYTGNGVNSTVGHGLSSAPEMVITKWRTGGTAQGWPVYHSSIGNTKYLALNLTDAESTNSTLWNNTSPTSTNFSIGTNTWVNGSSWTYISYCFHSVESYSKIGSYTGNGSTDGVFVHCGFRPAWVMVKRTDSANSWTLEDNIRDPHNPVDKYLLADQADAEGTTLYFDFLSNGFKLRTLTGASNASGASYIFMAFASAPFSKANAR